MTRWLHCSLKRFQRLSSACDLRRYVNRFGVQRAFFLGQPIPYETLNQLGIQTKKSLNEIAAGLYNESALKKRSRQFVYSQDFAEGRAAFAERRASKFTGN